MSVEQLYTGCLALGTYYIESNGEAAVIDPLRDPNPYIKMAEERGAKIKYVFETHFHADFVSGHIDLAAKTGASIIYGPTAKPEFEAHIAADGEEFKLGDYTIRVLHTPGHTMESSTYLLVDENGKDHSIFTGDTLFIGDVGRPDLAVKTDLSREDLAGFLYDSLHEKIMPLGNEVIVYPGHGAGSACGKNMSDETFDTLGNQKKVNYALQEMSKAEFIEQVLHGILPPPQYFPKNAVMNKTGYKSYDEVLATSNKPLGVQAFAMEKEKGALVIDTRHQDAFKKGFVPGSVFVGLEGNFAPWVGAVVEDLTAPILLVSDPGTQEEAIMRLSRVGYDNVVGYLEGGYASWASSGRPTDAIESVNAEELAGLIKSGAANVLDVRKPTEWQSEHVEGALNIPLTYINSQLDELDKDRTYQVHCAGGYRSVIANSILRRRGYDKLVDVSGGFKAIAETDVPRTDYVCPSTL